MAIVRTTDSQIGEDVERKKHYLLPVEVQINIAIEETGDFSKN